MDSKKIGEYIQIKRKELGITQVQLSEMLGITSKAVSKWETGVAIPDIALFLPLTKALNITIEELLQGEDNIAVVKKKINVSTILTIIIILLLILSCSIFIYFKTNYSKVDIYKIESANNNFYVEGNLMNIDGDSYLTISKVDYVGDELNILSSVYDFKYELYCGDVILYNDGNFDTNIEVDVTLKNFLSNIFINNVNLDMKSIFSIFHSDNFYFRIYYTNSEYEKEKIDLRLKIVEK